jgi:hypothetical protein
MKRFLPLAALAFLFAACGSPRFAQAHFLWLAQEKDGQLHAYFSEAAEADDPELLKYAEKAKGAAGSPPRRTPTDQLDP